MLIQGLKFDLMMRQFGPQDQIIPLISSGFLYDLDLRGSESSDKHFRATLGQAFCPTGPGFSSAKQ